MAPCSSASRSPSQQPTAALACDVLIVGSGIAGCTAALGIASRRRDWSIVLVDKRSKHELQGFLFSWQGESVLGDVKRCYESLLPDENQEPKNSPKEQTRLWSSLLEHARYAASGTDGYVGDCRLRDGLIFPDEDWVPSKNASAQNPQLISESDGKIVANGQHLIANSQGVFVGRAEFREFLLARLAKLSNAETRFGWEFQGFSSSFENAPEQREGQEHDTKNMIQAKFRRVVLAEGRQSSDVGEYMTIASRFVVGADGGRSTVRCALLPNLGSIFSSSNAHQIRGRCDSAYLSSEFLETLRSKAGANFGESSNFKTKLAKDPNSCTEHQDNRRRLRFLILFDALGSGFFVNIYDREVSWLVSIADDKTNSKISPRVYQDKYEESTTENTEANVKELLAQYMIAQNWPAELVAMVRGSHAGAIWWGRSQHFLAPVDFASEAEKSSLKTSSARQEEGARREEEREPPFTNLRCCLIGDARYTAPLGGARNAVVDARALCEVFSSDCGDSFLKTDGFSLWHAFNQAYAELAAALTRVESSEPCDQQSPEEALSLSHSHKEYPDNPSTTVKKKRKTTLSFQELHSLHVKRHFAELRNRGVMNWSTRFMFNWVIPFFNFFGLRGSSLIGRIVRLFTK
eukprot:TRINITY_DN43832_c0_g1_i1.p1 TRINITY_DN43832_c0_g1~~TRINITY_DN43832_c0_g1_i1.p1  ORF type:complete len:633 (-),score=76.42 TRINITY_DN43832_c0_g1_i1:275-2173(-)